MTRRIGSLAQCTAVLLVSMSVRVAGQVPATPNLPGPIFGLPPGPSVSDWQPRGRAVIGGTIVVQGDHLRPADLVAAIGSAGFRLPVRVASSSGTRVEIEVPDGALGLIGTLSVGYANTQGTVLETNYRIDPPAPAIADVSVGSQVTPFVLRNLSIVIREFPGVTLNQNTVSFGGSCGFKKRTNVSYPNVNRQSNLALTLSIAGWFENSGTCQLSVTMQPISATGSPTGTVTLTTPFTVQTPSRYTFDNTGDLIARLHPQLIHAGVGSVCEAEQNGVTKATGVTTIESDMQILVRGEPVNVDCAFRTDEWLLPAGVWVDEIQWKSHKTGIRCGLTGTFGGGAFNLTRGSILVRPDAGQPVSDFVAFGDRTISVDGVTFRSNLDGPRTMLKTLTMAGQCASMATVLTDENGSHPPTTETQAYGIILTRLVLKGPPGLSTSDLKNP